MQPGTQRAPALEGADLLPGGRERLLRQILRVCGVARQVQQEAIHSLVIIVNKAGAGFPPSRADCVQQFLVGSLRHIPSPHGYFV